MCPKRTSVVQSLELNFFFRCLHDNPSGQKIPPCYVLLSGEGELFWAVKKDDHSRHGGFITLKPPRVAMLQPR